MYKLPHSRTGDTIFPKNNSREKKELYAYHTFSLLYPARADGPYLHSVIRTRFGRDAKNETHFEVYYNFRVNKYLALSPSAQIILDPYGDDAGSEDLVAVYTLKSHVDF